MNLTELTAEVYKWTHRPDLTDLTQSAILSSTLALHMLEFFYKDISSGQVNFINAGYRQQIDISTVPQYRSLSYLRRNPEDPALLVPDPFTGLTPRRFLQPYMEIISPDDAIDQVLGYEKIDVAYQAGNIIFIKSGSRISSLLFGFYIYPNMNPSTYSSWIANEKPYAIVFSAAANILHGIGDEQLASQIDRPQKTPMDPGGPLQQEITALRQMNIVARGY